MITSVNAVMFQRELTEARQYKKWQELTSTGTIIVRHMGCAWRGACWSRSKQYLDPLSSWMFVLCNCCPFPLTPPPFDDVRAGTGAGWSCSAGQTVPRL